MSRAAPLLNHFSDLADPRMARTREHSLESILFIAICAVIAGEDDWVSIEEFARDKVDFFEQFIDLPNGIPSHDTFGRVFAALDTEAFAQGFTRWVQCVSESLALPHQGVIAIDGKTMRRTFDKANGKAAIHLVSAFASGHRLVLGQVKVDDKSNEITAIPELLRRLTLAGCLVTLDAMGCQKQIAHDITTAGADYLLALKGNHGDLHRDVIDHFAHVDNTAAIACHRHETVDGGHGRAEKRVVETVPSDWHPDRKKWRNLQAFVRVTAERHVGETHSREVRYFLSSLSADQVERVAEGIRQHWRIENTLHWTLDMAFSEDYQRKRVGDAPANMALLNKMALNLLKQETSCKLGIKNKRRKAARSDEYLMKVLASAGIH